MLRFGGASVGLTYTVNVAREIKIGKSVTISFKITVNDNGSSSGAATIAGLTHAAETITGMQWSVGGYADTLTTATGLVCWIASGASVINLGYPTAGGVSSLTETEITNGATISCSLTYQAAA